MSSSACRSRVCVHPDVQDLVGMFVNTVPWRARVPDTGTIRDFLEATRETSLKVLASEEYELEALLEELGVQPVAGRNPPAIPDVMFSFQARDDGSIDACAVRLHNEEFLHRVPRSSISR